MTDEQKVAMRKWLTGLPPDVQALAREWPPMGKVRTESGVVLLIPAPGVDGEIGGWTESGQVVVAAPVTIPHPEHGFGAAQPGEMVTAHVEPEQLVLVEEGPVGFAGVEEALS